MRPQSFSRGWAGHTSFTVQVGVYFCPIPGDEEGVQDWQEWNILSPSLGLLVVSSWVVGGGWTLVRVGKTKMTNSEGQSYWGGHLHFLESGREMEWLRVCLQLTCGSWIELYFRKVLWHTHRQTSWLTDSASQNEGWVKNKSFVRPNKGWVGLDKTTWKLNKFDIFDTFPYQRHILGTGIHYVHVN